MVSNGETSKDAYNRGVAAGNIEQRLMQMDKHFTAINGSQEDTAQELKLIRLQLQRLADAFEASGRTEIAKASALKTEREDKANELKDALARSVQTWSPLNKIGAIIALCVGIITIISFIIVVSSK